MYFYTKESYAFISQPFFWVLVFAVARTFPGAETMVARKFKTNGGEGMVYGRGA
jgi:hypothetical protein